MDVDVEIKRIIAPINYYEILKIKKGIITLMIIIIIKNLQIKSFWRYCMQ